jgi:hypothetical protein
MNSLVLNDKPLAFTDLRRDGSQLTSNRETVDVLPRGTFQSSCSDDT